MVNIAAVRVGPFLRVLNHRVRTARWRELRQLFKNGDASHSTAGKTLAGFSTSPRFSHQPPLLFQMASAYWVSQTIYVAAKLAIADLLDGAPKSAKQLADEVEADE